ncbi:hypothetical protein, partial [Arthrobacter gyeryongensis]|uniref:hypothetical protein n=1 Tax=Arthrobacter gyeryongensis TaxID=1650592 RepID=UPI0031E9FEB8
MNQYFTLLDYMHEDSRFRRQLHLDLQLSSAAPSSDNKRESTAPMHAAGAFRLLGGMLDIFSKFADLYDSFAAPAAPRNWLESHYSNSVGRVPQPDSVFKEELAVSYIDYATDVVAKIWGEAAAALAVSQSDLAETVLSTGSSFRSSATHMLG